MSQADLERHRARLARFEAAAFHDDFAGLVAAAARRDPDRQAIVFIEDDEALTRRQLDEESSRMANALAAIGVAKGAHVGVMLPNRREYPITWIALARLGAVMVPINPRYTARELDYVLTDSEASFLVIDEAHLPLFESLPNRPAALTNDRVIVRGAPALAGARQWSALCARGAPTHSPACAIGADTVVNIQYTSGTTGFPKGCQLPQGYWLMLARQTMAWTEPPVRRMFAQNPYHYMNGQFMLLAALAMGATLFVARQPSATRFLPWIKEHAIEWCVFPEIVLKQPARDDDATTNLKQVMLVAVSPQGHREIERRFNVRGRELFGMTEIGGGTAMPYVIDDMLGSGSVGLPMLARRATIRDADGACVAPGEPGELWQSGPHMMKGYYRKPEANADSFRGEWFRTGDIARMDERGFVWIIGRSKDMVRRSGENIAAREVEVVALMLPEIEEAAVVAVPDPDRGEEVKIFLQLKPGVPREALPPERVLAHCRANLAPFKVPRYLAFIAEIPRTASNKIEKGTLRALAADPIAGTYDGVEKRWR